MIVIWHKVNINDVPLIERKGKVSVQKGKVTLFPGPNDVKPEEWELMKASLADHIKTGVVEIVTKTDERGDENPVEFSEMHDEKKLELIAKAVKISQLREWRKESSSEEIRLACANRIDEIRKARQGGGASNQSNE